jgi:hypothetical protein
MSKREVHVVCVCVCVCVYSLRSFKSCTLSFVFSGTFSSGPVVDQILEFMEVRAIPILPPIPIPIPIPISNTNPYTITCHECSTCPCPCPCPCPAPAASPRMDLCLSMFINHSCFFLFFFVFSRCLKSWFALKPRSLSKTYFASEREMTLGLDWMVS